MSEVSQEVVARVDDSVRRSVDNITSGNLSFYSSFKGDDFDTKKRVAAALANSIPLNEHLNTPFELSNVIIQIIQMEDEKTGEMRDAARTTLITSEGVALHSVSQGVLRSVENLIAMLGEPNTWPEPVTVTVSEQRSRSGFRFYTLNIS